VLYLVIVVHAMQNNIDLMFSEQALENTIWSFSFWTWSFSLWMVKNVKLFVVWALNSVRFVIDRVNGREKIFLHFLDFFEGILQLFISNLEKLKRKYTGQFF